MEKTARVKYQDALDRYEIALRNAKVYVLPKDNKVIISTRKSPGRYLLQRSGGYHPSDKRRDDSRWWIHAVPSKESPTGSDQAELTFAEPVEYPAEFEPIRLGSIPPDVICQAEQYEQAALAAIRDGDASAAIDAAQRVYYYLIERLLVDNER